ncbi:MAG: DNA repair protein RecO [Gemmobacter sp.]|uniref:DNA repair protein RecO n=1 Tax=Gemmobacter sp. TaxID=1898957 RepID=UPI00391DE194
MEWSGEALVLSVRAHGEGAAIVEVFTAAQGRHAGVVRGGAGRRLAPVLMPGNTVAVVWRARLGEHLGHFTVEPVKARAAALMGDRMALAGLSSVCALLLRALPERAPHAAVHAATLTLLEAMELLPDWPVLYLRWEIGLLAELGFGLDLGRCAATGATAGLAWVSPRTGRAVTAAAARGWEDRLLPLPPLLLGAPADPEGLAQGLALTGHFLARALATGPEARPLPEARARLVDLMARNAAG